MAIDEKKKKISIIALSSILLVAVIGGVTYGVTREDGKSSPEDNGQVSTSAKAVKTLCRPTEYQETCERSLEKANTDNPLELIKIVFQAPIKEISEAIKKTSLYKEASMDPLTSQALDICKDVLNKSIGEIQKSFDEVSDFDLTKSSTIGDLQTWLTAAAAFRYTCLDGFGDLPGDTGDKMRNLLKTAKELTSNGLSIVATLEKLFLDLSDFVEIDYDQISPVPVPVQAPAPVSSRKLLQAGTDDFPPFVDAISRGILSQPTPKPDVVVALDGSGDVRSINEAITRVPEKNQKPFIIFVKAGVYNEYVLIPTSATRVVLLGEGPTKTKITGNRSYKDGFLTFNTATVAVEADYFIARDIGFENSAGALKEMAVALRIGSDSAVISNCEIDGYQDTLLVHDKRQFYRDCTISGTVDFVFGYAHVVFQNCKLVARNPHPKVSSVIVAANGRGSENEVSSFVFYNCIIDPAPDFMNANPPVEAYLGRPWGKFSKVVFMNSNIVVPIQALGWEVYRGNEQTAYLAEFQNQGVGANTAGRQKWPSIKLLDEKTANTFMPHRAVNTNFGGEPRAVNTNFGGEPRAVNTNFGGEPELAPLP